MTHPINQTLCSNFQERTRTYQPSILHERVWETQSFEDFVELVTNWSYYEFRVLQPCRTQKPAFYNSSLLSWAFISSAPSFLIFHWALQNVPKITIYLFILYLKIIFILCISRQQTSTPEKLSKIWGGAYT